MKESKVPFHTRGDRFKVLKPVVDVPGPGQYKQKTIVEDVTSKPWGKMGKFGSMERRFVVPKTSEAPPPNSYYPDRSIKVMAKLGDSNIKKCSSMFLSNARRDEDYGKKGKNMPEPGAYTVKNYDVAEQAMK